MRRKRILRAKIASVGKKRCTRKKKQNSRKKKYQQEGKREPREEQKRQKIATVTGKGTNVEQKSQKINATVEKWAPCWNRCHR